MAFEPSYDVIKTNERSELTQSQAVVEAKLIPPPGVSIVKVLSVEAQSSISAAEVFTGEARYNGKVNFTVLILDADGNKHCLDYTAEFTDKITDDSITGDITPIFTSRVLDIDLTSVDGNEIKPACVVEIALFADKTDGFKFLSSAGDGVIAKQNYAEYASLVVSGKHEFTAESSILDCKISKVLKCNGVITVKKATTLSDCVKIEGEVTVSVVGESENGELVQLRQALPYAEEVAAEGARATDEAVVNATVRSTNIRIISEDGKLSAEITAECEAYYSVYSSGASNIICDLFHPEFELIVKAEKKHLYCGVLSTCFCDCLPGSLTLDESSPLADEVICADGFRANVTSGKIEGGKIVAEGIICGSIVYRNAEKDELSSVSVSIPFSVSENARLSGATNVLASATVTGVTVKSRRGNELDVKTDLCFSCVESKIKPVIFLSSAELGEAKPQKTTALSVHIGVKGEDLWETAKALCTTPDEVMAQNAGVEFPLKGNEKIVLYRKL